MSHIPICVWDFTLSVKKSSDNHLDIIRELEQIAKKWTFQLEKGSIYEEMKESDTESENSSSDTLTDYENLEIFSDFDENDYVDNEYDDETFDNEDEFFDNEDDFYDNEEINEEYEESDEEDLDSDGYLHYQGRISLFKKKRIKDLKRLLKENNFYLQLAHFSPTVSNTVGQVFYCMKLDTRIKGPWSDEDDKEIPIPRQLKHIKELYPYQQEIIDRSMYCWSSRYINVLVDTLGCKGKSTLALWCAVKKLGKQIPPLNSYEDIMSCIMSMPIQKLYFIDMPRAINKSKLYEFYAGIESIKNGFCFDKRYKYTEKYFDSPELWIFTNTLPKEDLFSRDRWRFWMIEDNELYIYNKSGIKIKGCDIVYPIDTTTRDLISELLINWKSNLHTENEIS